MAVNGAISRVERCHGFLVFHRFGGHDASHSDPQFIVPLITTKLNVRIQVVN
jgi:hypothetical protein